MGDEPDPGLKERFFFANLNRNALNARKRTFDEFLKMIPAPMSQKHSQQVALAKTQAFYLQYTTSGGQFNLNSGNKTEILSVLSENKHFFVNLLGAMPGIIRFIIKISY